MTNTTITAKPSTAIKCPRCWHYHYFEMNHDGLCDRCQQVMLNDYPDHDETPRIREAIKRQLERWKAKPKPLTTASEG